MDDPSRKRGVSSDVVTNSTTMAGQQVTDPKSNKLAIVPVSGGVVSPPPKRDPKRTKVGSEGKEGTSVAGKNLAGSNEGHHRGQ